jgi:hypothetical protein
VTNSFKLAIVTAVLLCLACGKKPAPKSVTGLPAEAFAPLTEDDVARFTRALPAVVEYLSWHGMASGEKLRARDDAAKVLAATIEWVPKTAGIDSVFAANGVDWPFFRAMLYRVAVCAWTVGLAQTEDQARRAIRSQSTRAMAGALRKRLKQMKEIAAAVPASNMEMFNRHYQDLKGFFYIVEADEQ